MVVVKGTGSSQMLRLGYESLVHGLFELSIRHTLGLEVLPEGGKFGVLV